MIAYAAILALQIACIVHVIKTGRNQLWIMALFFLPVASAIAYFVIEVLPGLQGNRHVRTVKAKAVARLDPERELRAARDALELADTVANRTQLAEALADLGRHAEAVTAYREALSMRAGGDARTKVSLAASLFELGETEEALAILDGVDPPSGQGESDRRAMLRARVLDHLGRKDEALAIYADVVTRLPRGGGAVPLCRATARTRLRGPGAARA